MVSNPSMLKTSRSKKSDKRSPSALYKIPEPIWIGDFLNQKIYRKSSARLLCHEDTGNGVGNEKSCLRNPKTTPMGGFLLMASMFCDRWREDQMIFPQKVTGNLIENKTAKENKI